MEASFRVSFLVAGVQKGGTTSLDYYLRQHSQVFMAKQKEVHFFDDESQFPISSSNYSNYHAFFEKSDNAVHYGETTPIYTYWVPAVPRIWEYNPEMRLIVLLRDPVTRAWSHWKYMCSIGEENRDFGYAIRNEISRSQSTLPLQHRFFSYIDRGFYCEQIRRVYRFFPQEQVLFVRSEDFFSDPQEILQRICTFLRIDGMNFSVDSIHNKGADYGDMEKTDRDLLAGIFLGEILGVESLLQWRCAQWLSRRVRFKFWLRL